MATKAKKVKLTAEQLRAEEAQVTREVNAYLAITDLDKANEMLFGPDASAGKPDPVAAYNARIEEAKRVAAAQRGAAEARDAYAHEPKPVKELESDDLDFVPVKTAPAPFIAPAHDHGDLRGQLTDYVGLVKFISAGNAILTVKSRKSGERLTFKFSRPKDEAATGRVKPIFVALLSGPNNDSDYQFLGTIFPEASNFTYKVSAKSRVSYTAPSQEFVRWFVKQLNVSPENIFARAEIWHEGRCGRCGRRLTVPESVASGFGPECISHV
jgi:hypothetical protein